MPRTARIDIGGYIYHVINRANARAQIFDGEKMEVQSRGVDRPKKE